MKTYFEIKHHEGSFINVDVNIPTPKEVRAITIRGNFKIVVTNFSNVTEDVFTVALYTAETNPLLIRKGISHKTQPINLRRITGKCSRADIVTIASDFLIGR